MREMKLALSVTRNQTIKAGLDTQPQELRVGIYVDTDPAMDVSHFMFADTVRPAPYEHWLIARPVTAAMAAVKAMDIET